MGYCRMPEITPMEQARGERVSKNPMHRPIHVHVRYEAGEAVSNIEPSVENNRA